MSVMQDPLAGPSALRDIIKPQFHQVNLSAEYYVKKELGIKLDKCMKSSLSTKLTTE